MTWLDIILSTTYKRCLTSHRRHVDIVAASGLLCQRCTYIKWNEGAGDGLMQGMWPSDCEHGVTLEDKETCPAGNRHVCALLVTSFSLIYSTANPTNVTSPRVKPTGKNVNCRTVQAQWQHCVFYIAWHGLVLIKI